MTPVQISFDRHHGKRLLGRGAGWERSTLGVALLVSIGVLGAVAWEAHALRLEHARLRAAIDQARPIVAPPAPRPLRPSTPVESLRQMDAVTARLNVPWSNVFDAIERRTSGKVALLAIETDAQTAHVGLTAEAPTLDDLLSYVEALEQDAVVAAVRIGQHTLQADEPGRPVRMSLSVSPAPWRP